MIHPKIISIGPKTDIAISLPYNNREDKNILSRARRHYLHILLFVKKIKNVFLIKVVLSNFPFI